MITCRHANESSMDDETDCCYCYLESVNYHGYKPEVYNLGYDMLLFDNRFGRKLRRRRMFYLFGVFKSYYNKANNELRIKKIKSIL